MYSEMEKNVPDCRSFSFSSVHEFIFFEESHFEKLLFNQTFDRWPKILKKNLIAHFHTQINDYYDRLMIVN